MLRVTRKEEGRAVTLHLEGRLLSEWAALLEGEVETVLTSSRQVRLDLAHVAFVDGGGREALKRLLSRQVEIVNCPPLILQILAMEGGS